MTRPRGCTLQRFSTLWQDGADHRLIEPPYASTTFAAEGAMQSSRTRHGSNRRSTFYRQEQRWRRPRPRRAVDALVDDIVVPVANGVLDACLNQSLDGADGRALRASVAAVHDASPSVGMSRRLLRSRSTGGRRSSTRGASTQPPSRTERKNKKPRGYRGFLNQIWSGKRDLNPRPPPWQGDALPLSYSRVFGTAFVAACCPATDAEVHLV